MSSLTPVQIELFAHRLEYDRELVISWDYALELLRGYRAGPIEDDRQGAIPLPYPPDHRPRSVELVTIRVS